MRINHNAAAASASRGIATNSLRSTANLEKLSSGKRINKAGDDAAGLAISEKMNAQIRGLKQASRNAQDGISLVQTAEGALNETQNILQRIKELATQSSTGTLADDVDRDAIQTEVNNLVEEIDRISSTTNFNGIKLLDGTVGAGKSEAAEYTKGGLVTTEFDGVGASITNITGVNVKDTDTVAVEAGATGNDIKFTITDTEGNATTKVLDLAELISNKDGSTFAGAIGQEAKLDLSSVGLGTIEFTVSDAAIDVDALAGALETVFDEGAPVAFADGTGSGGGALHLQVGDTTENAQRVAVNIGDMSSSALGVKGLDLSNQDVARAAIDKAATAINTVSTQRGDLGAVQNRLESTINNLNTTTDNLANAKSNIADVDMADEMLEFSKNNILTQAATAMLTQAKSQPDSILQILR